MVARDTTEAHRASTPLELLFDLCFVVAASQASGRLHHALTSGEVGYGIGSYLLVFFAIWWAWVNFTWFASAYDNDDVAYRIATLVQITGALILAAGVPRAFDDNNFTVVVIGYVVMRLALVGQWLRAAFSDPPRRRTALRFAVGITIVQAAWVARLWLPSRLHLASFLVLVVAELLVPIVAERAERTTWHAVHIAERYGLFTLIVLGESILAATTAVQTAFDTGLHLGSLLVLAAAGLLIVFGMWWLYFDRPGQDALSTAASGFIWGYGHYLIFASAAAVGAGIVANVNVDDNLGQLSTRGAAYAIAIPVSTYLLSVWWLHSRPAYANEDQRTVKAWALPVGALLILLAPLVPAALPVVAAIVVLLVVIKTVA
jgi:low temperature requirement protein LtrA